MRRRQVLALAAVGLGGCLSDSSPSSNGTENGTTTRVATNAHERTTEGVPRTTGTPDPPDLRAYPGDCANVREEVPVVCSDVAPDGSPLRMAASGSSVDLPGELTFTLRNDSESTFEINPYAATLSKEVDGEWFDVAPTVVPMPALVLPGGSTHQWEVSFEGGTQSVPRGGGESERTVGGLGGGRYAFGIHGDFYGDDTSYYLAAPLDLRGRSVRLTPTDDVTDASVDGSTLTARWTANEDHRYADPATYVLGETDAEPDRRLITEQVLQPDYGQILGRPLRDALALFGEYDVTVVELEGKTGSQPAFGARGQVVGYEGQSYEITAKETE